MIFKPDNDNKNNYDYNYDCRQQALDEKHSKTSSLVSEVWVSGLDWKLNLRDLDQKPSLRGLNQEPSSRNLV